VRKKRRCSPQCPPRRPDGTIVAPSLFNLCLLCWNTGWVLPVNGKHSIDEWVKMHEGKEAHKPARAINARDISGVTEAPPR